MSVGQAAKFAIVGAAATCVHYATAVTFVAADLLSPRVANAGAFVVAFVVSFLGQWKWTFRDREVAARRALPAYSLVASLSFVLNAILFELLLKFSYLPYYVSLALVLTAVAVVTYLASRLWAFRVQT